MNSSQLCEFLARESVNSSPILARQDENCEGRNERGEFLARKSVNSSQLCDFLARESVN